MRANLEGELSDASQQNAGAGNAFLCIPLKSGNKKTENKKLQAGFIAKAYVQPAAFLFQMRDITNACKQTVCFAAHKRKPLLCAMGAKNSRVCRWCRQMFQISWIPVSFQRKTNAK